MNRLEITVVGNLTSDPELRFTAAGVAVCSFSVAFNPRKLDRQSGEWVDGEPTFFQCSAWRDLGEHVAESLQRGHRVILTGELRTERWESDGTGKTAKGEKLQRQVLDVSAIGPDLTFATATVNKATRGGRGEGPADDPWATATPARPTSDREPAAAGGRRGGRSSNIDDEPPF